MNPELHYPDHLQNNSISKQCSRFAKASRFKAAQTSYLWNLFSQTEFNYHPKQNYHSRSCNFGFGQRVNINSSLSQLGPSPNKYNLRKFPNKSSVAHKMGLSREEACFGSIKVEIKNQANNPAPCSYKIKGGLKTNRFTIK